MIPSRGKLFRKLCGLAAMLACLSIGCDFKLPQSTVYRHTSLPEISGLPFDDGNTTAIAWHPDGRRLAVMGKFQNSRRLTGLALQTHKLRSYFDLDLQKVWNPTMLAGRRLLIAQDLDGRLYAWSLDTGESRIFFDEPLPLTSWSLDARGSILAYAERLENESYLYRLVAVDIASRTHTVLVDSVYRVASVRLLPDGETVLFVARAETFDSGQEAIYHTTLRDRRTERLYRGERLLRYLTVAPDNRHYACIGLGENPARLLIGEIDGGIVDSMAISVVPSSNLVWPRSEFKLYGMEFEQNEPVSILRTQHLLSYEVDQKQVSTIFSSTSTNTSPLYASWLSAVADTILFFSELEERVGVYDIANRQFTPWSWTESKDENVLSMTWTPSGESLVIHARNQNNGTTFHFVDAAGSREIIKSYPCRSVSLLSDTGFVAIQSQRLFRGSFYNEEQTFILPALRHERVAAQSRSLIVAALSPITSFNFEETFRTMRLIDLGNETVIDSLVVSSYGRGEMKWLAQQGVQQRPTLLWCGYHGLGFPRYHVITFLPAWKVQVYDGFSNVFSPYPSATYFTVLEGNTLRSIEWLIPVN